MSATPEELKQRIEAGIPGARPTLQATGTTSTPSSPRRRSTGLNRIAQHRLVYDVFGAELGDRIHALSIQTKAPEQET